jgi:hypothetical protein
MGPVDLVIIAAEALDRAGAPYFLTGSLGAMAYGPQRLTTHVDIVVDNGYAAASALEERFVQPEWAISREAMIDAMHRCAQFNVTHAPTSLKIDFMVAAESAFNVSRFARARTVEVRPGASLRASAPEDVILMKLKFYRQGASDEHLPDIE